jgi:hypothetical protein
MTSSFTWRLILDGSSAARYPVLRPWRQHRCGWGQTGPGKREIDAQAANSPRLGRCHTHYDGQATTDLLAPSSWHGVTTIMFSNCGVGLHRSATTPPPA